MIELLKLTIISTLGIVGAFIVFGFLIGVIERQTEVNLYGKFGEKSVIITGLIGTTVHEFSHYIMCKLFLHKVIDVKFFSIKVKRNELGHVSHSYNKRSLYQRVGNFFIGIAPILFGTLIIILLFKVLLPENFNNTIINLNLKEYLNLANNFSIITFIIDLLRDSMIIVLSLFKIANLISFKFWIFLFLAISISTHMSLSKADLKNSIDGIIFIFIISFIINGIMMIINVSSADIFSFILVYNIMVVVFLFFAIIFSVIALIISQIIALI